MAGYWPSSFFACLWTETKSRSINSQKKTRPIFSHLDRTNLVNKGFIIWLLVKFCLRDTAGSPERARWLHLARSGSQSQRAIWFILPAHGASHIIRENNAQAQASQSMRHICYKHKPYNKMYVMRKKINWVQLYMYCNLQVAQFLFFAVMPSKMKTITIP